MTAETGNLPKLREVHVAGRRARLRPDKDLPRDELVALADAIAALPGVRRTLARPGTGSLIVETDRPAREVLDEITAEEVARVAPPAKGPPVNQVMQMGLARMDMGLRSQTRDGLDLRTAIALALLAGALVQIGRGRVAGPATTLAMSALALLDRGGGK